MQPTDNNSTDTIKLFCYNVLKFSLRNDSGLCKYVSKTKLHSIYQRRLKSAQSVLHNKHSTNRPSYHTKANNHIHKAGQCSYQHTKADNTYPTSRRQQVTVKLTELLNSHNVPTTNASRQLHVLRHNGDAFSMNGTEVGILKQVD